MRLFLATCLLFVTSPAWAQWSAYLVGNERREVRWDDLVGQVVTVDGLAWGGFHKGLGPHLILPHLSERVYISHNELEDDGKLRRVTGVLSKHHMPAADPSKFEQGYGQAFDYFKIEVIANEPIEKVTEQLLPACGTWIYKGMSADAAINLLARGGLQESGPLQMTAPRDGSTVRTYSIAANETLLLNILQGKVSGVARVDHRGYGRADDDWVDVNGYCLPAPKQASSKIQGQQIMVK